MGTKENCLTYNVDSDVCSVCKNKFYLFDGGCKSHTEVANCLTYSNT